MNNQNFSILVHGKLAASMTTADLLRQPLTITIPAGLSRDGLEACANPELRRKAVKRLRF